MRPMFSVFTVRSCTLRKEWTSISLLIATTVIHEIFYSSSMSIYVINFLAIKT